MSKEAKECAGLFFHHGSVHFQCVVLVVKWLVNLLRHITLYQPHLGPTLKYTHKHVKLGATPVLERMLQAVVCGVSPDQQVCENKVVYMRVCVFTLVCDQAVTTGPSPLYVSFRAVMELWCLSLKPLH